MKEKATVPTVSRPAPGLRPVALLCAYLLLTALALEADRWVFSVPLIPDAAERCLWIRYFYVFFIVATGTMFGRRGILVSVLLAFAALVGQSVLVCPNTWLAMKQSAVALVLGSVSSLYWLHLQDDATNRAWYEKARKKYYDKARQRVERDKQLSALSDYSHRVALYADIDDVLEIGLDIAIEAMKADTAAIYAFDDDKASLFLLSSKGLLAQDAVGKEPIRTGDGLIGSAVKAGSPVFAYRFQEEFCLPQALAEEKFTAMAVVPLIVPGKTIGALLVAYRTERILGKQENLVLETVGSQLSLAMENALLSREQKNIRERLSESERQYRDIFEKTNDIIWLEGVDGQILSGNKACAAVLAVDLEALATMNIYQFISAAGTEKAKSIREQLTGGLAEEKSYDQPVVNCRGEEIILKVTTNLAEFWGETAFLHIAKDITEERVLQENRENYIQLITKAQEEERLRISRELHDSTAQSLIVVMHQLEKFLMSSKHLYVSDSRFLFQIVEQVKAILQEVRQYSRDLRPSLLDDLGLIPSLEWYFEELNRTHGLVISMHVQGNSETLRPEIRVTLFRIIQEALRNVIKHAEAAHARVVITYGEHDVKVTVSDDGSGFDSRPLGDLLRHGKLGVAGMHERAKLLGGSVRIESEEGEGTTVYITVPI